MNILQPPNWAKPKGYANGIKAKGEMIFIAGQIGWDENCQFQSDDFVAQTHQALLNIVAVLNEAGATPQHLVRLTWYIINKDEYLMRSKEIGMVFKEIIGNYNIAMSAVEVKSLMEARAKIEIEATAMV